MWSTHLSGGCEFLANVRMQTLSFRAIRTTGNQAPVSIYLSKSATSRLRFDRCNRSFISLSPAVACCELPPTRAWRQTLLGTSVLTVPFASWAGCFEPVSLLLRGKHLGEGRGYPVSLGKVAYMKIPALNESGGRQLRVRKEVTVSAQILQAKNQDEKDSNDKKVPHEMQKKSQKQSKEEAQTQDLEVCLKALQADDELKTLTVMKLREFMRQMQKPTVGRKQDLIVEVEKWLAERAGVTLHAQEADQISNDESGQSLEEVVLKAEVSSGKPVVAPSPRKQARNNVKETVAASPMAKRGRQKKATRDALADVADNVATDAVVPTLGDELSGRRRSPRGALQKTVAEKLPSAQKSSKDKAGAEVKAEVKAEENVKIGPGTSGTKRKMPSLDSEKVVVGKGSKSDGPSEEKKMKKGVARKMSSKESPENLPLKTATETDGDNEAWSMLVHKKPQPNWVAYNPSTMRPVPTASSVKTMKFVSWNVNGLRALLKEKGMQHEEGPVMVRLAAREDFDVLCLQETKLQEKDVEQLRQSLLASHEESIWSCSTGKLGYSGTAVFSRIKPVSVKYGLGISDHDNEGRVITVEFNSFYLVVCYVPNSGGKLERLAYRTNEWDPAFSGYLKELEKMKPVILTGDLNCAHQEIDIYNPDGNKRSAGFTTEERDSFEKHFLKQGLVDTFRRQHPNAVGYTYWGYRTASRPKNRGGLQ